MMTYVYTPYIWPFIVTIVLNLLLIFYLIKNRHMRGASAFSFTLLLSSLWCMGTVMEISAVQVAAKLFWTQLAYPAYAFSPLAWFVMVMQLTDQRHWVKWERAYFLCIIPIITVVLVWTNGFHKLIWYDVLMDQDKVPYTMILKHGGWFWVHAVYSDGLNLFSVFHTIRFWWSKAPLYARQFGYLAFSMLFVMLVNGAYVMKIGPDIDTTPVAWGISSLFILWALFRNKLFDLVPIARNRIIESMTDSIIVLDLKKRIVAMNPSAQATFCCDEIHGIGQTAKDFFGLWPHLKAFIPAGEKQFEFIHKKGNEEQYYEAMCLSVKKDRDNLLGTLLVLRNITEKKRTENEIQKKLRQIAVKKERERIAGELSVNLGQVMKFINVQTQAVQQYLKYGETERAVQSLEHLTAVSQQAHNTIRETILSMREQRNRKKDTDFQN